MLPTANSAYSTTSNLPPIECTTYEFNRPDTTPDGIPLYATTSTHLNCGCADQDHMITVRTWVAADRNNARGYQEFDIGMQAAPDSSMWVRAKRALRYIFTGNTTESWWHSTSLSDESVITLHDQCEKYLQYVRLHDEQRQQSSAPVAPPEPPIITAAEVEECIRKAS